MKPQESDALLDGWVNRRLTRPASLRTAILDLINKTMIVLELEVRKLRHDPSDVLLRSVQPALWLLIFGQVFSRIRAIPSEGLPYLDFMAPGILSQGVLYMAILTGGMSIIWERDLGIVHKFLASPTPRVAMVLGKGLGCAVRSLSQLIIIYGIALLLGVKLNFNPLSILGVLVFVILGALCFATFSLVIACLVKTRERFTGVGQLLTMPLFFASNAIYPISLMPGWLQVISHINPLTYQVDALRCMMLAHGSSTYGLTLDFAILLFAVVVLTVIGGRLYPRVAI